MGLSSNLDLDELLRYFLSGSFFMAICAIGRPDLALEMAAILDPLSETALASVAYVVVLSSIALILGHTFSIIVRNIERKILNSILGDPEIFILPKEINAESRKGPKNFYTENLQQMFSERFQKVFNQELNKETAAAMPRLVRSYVFHNSESARSIRDRLVRVRSFCANMAMSCVFAAAVNCGVLPISSIATLLGAALLLIIKQRSLDEREAKEVYAHFLAL